MNDIKGKNMISFEYNKKKIFLFLIFSFLIITFFLFLLFNAETLALKKPSAISKYRIVGELFYENENLIKIVSAFILTLFIYFFFLLSNMLVRNSVIFKSQNGFLYQDEKLIVEISRIESLQLQKTNKNHFIHVHLNNANQFIKNESNLLRKLKYKLLNFTENTPLILNLNYMKSEPQNILEKLRKLIKDKKTAGNNT